MAKINWTQIAGTVVGGVVNFFAPGAGTVAAKAVESGLNIAADVVDKIKTQKESGVSDEAISKSLTAEERARLVSSVNEQAQANAQVEQIFADWVNSQSAADRLLSKWRKSAKMSGKNPDLAETFSFDGTKMYWGKESLNVADLVIFAGFPNFRTANTVLSDAMTDTGTGGGTGGGTAGQENLNLSEIEDELQGPAKEQAQQTTQSKKSYSWVLMVFAALLVWFFFIRSAAMKRAKAMKAARAAKNRKKAQGKAVKLAALEKARKTRLSNLKKSNQ